MTGTQIVVIGPGIVGAPMAALLARAAQAGAYGVSAQVTVVQRDSPTSGWKVATINAGRSPIGGIEPGLNTIYASVTQSGHLAATHAIDTVADADVFLVCVQTDKRGLAPDYGPLLGAVDGLIGSLKTRTVECVPLVIFESTLAPSTMASVLAPRFAAAGLTVHLGNSPNRVMPGRLVERIASADKIVGTEDPETERRILDLYRPLVTAGTVHPTDWLTAEIVKTLENTWRDVRIAYAAEVARGCDDLGVDFWTAREQVNLQLDATDNATWDGAVVPTGALLVPLLGVGGHCLPKDGILLRWRTDEADPKKAEHSLIHAARCVNDAGPAWALQKAETRWGSIAGQTVAILGVAYRGDSDDARNAPSLALAALLKAHGCTVRLHDPYVRADDTHVAQAHFTDALTTDLDLALEGANFVFLAQAHQIYRDQLDLLDGRGIVGVFDAGNVWPNSNILGIGRSNVCPSPELVSAITDGYRTLAIGFANELAAVVADLSHRFGNHPILDQVRRLAATCATGCDVPAPAPAPKVSLPFPCTLLDLACR